MTQIKSALERVILDLDNWCDTYHPSMYTDPTKSLKVIANRVRHALGQQDEMEEIDPSLIIKDNDCIYYFGIKYKRVEPPKMELLFKASTHIIDYNKQTYYRIEKENLPPVWYRRSKTDEGSHKLVHITDKETGRLLELMYLGDVNQ